MKTLPLLILAFPLAMGVASAAHAVDSATDDHWVVRVGAHVVDPQSNNGTLAGMRTTISKDTKPTESIEYMLTPAIGIDALAAIPFRHEVRLNGYKAASTKQLPPVIGVNYHFLRDQPISPFVGVGVNFTRFFSSRGEGVLSGDHVSIANSWGAAAHAGIDIALSPRWLVMADLRWIDIRSDVHVNGVNVGKAKVDPLAYGLSVGYRF